jgi:hypothetical protein
MEMNDSNRGSLLAGIILLALGAILIVLNLIPGVRTHEFWPLIFVIGGIGFFLPVFLWPSSRHGLAGLFIPGTIILVLGLLFLYNTISYDWGVWVFGWMLIPAATGFGIYLGAAYGDWGDASKQTGLWIGVIGLALFSFFAAIFGTPFIRYLGSFFLIVTGVVFILRSIRKPGGTT